MPRAEVPGPGGSREVLATHLTRLTVHRLGLGQRGADDGGWTSDLKADATRGERPKRAKTRLLENHSLVSPVVGLYLEMNPRPPLRGGDK